ncbi:Domain of unknown function DUF374 [Rhabdaerophilaceae bacterium]
MLKALGRSTLVRQSLGSVMASYLRLVQRTSGRMLVRPDDAYARVDALTPAIFTMWHGQHFMQTFALRPQDRVHVMISRHGDGEINAIAAEKLGMGVVRGSGAQRSDQVRKRGGVKALRQLLTLIERGEHVSMTADVPKVSRVAGEGIIMLAQLSGRPILPVAVVSSRRLDFRSWDAASLGWPFGRMAFQLGEPLYVPREADGPMRETLRQALEASLDQVCAAAYGALGQIDPGAGRASVAEARGRRIAQTLLAQPGNPASAPDLRA